jgi:hypothetical protein
MKRGRYLVRNGKSESLQGDPPKRIAARARTFIVEGVAPWPRQVAAISWCQPATTPCRSALPDPR